MKYEKVVIKQIPDSSNGTAFGLEKYNKSRFPGCIDRLQPSLLPDGRYLTGLDPEGYDVYLIKDEELREERKKELEELAINLKRILPNTDLSSTSSFWEQFYIQISTDQDLTLNKINPTDVIKYHVLIANGYVAPTKQAIENPIYRDCKYYCHVDEVEEKEKVSIQKLRDKAKGILSDMSQNKDLMLLIGRYLQGTKFKDRMLTDTIYGNLSDYIEDRLNPDNVAAFVKATKMSVEDLTFKVTVDTAIRKRIIEFKNGQYVRGGANLGKNALEVIKNLKLPEFATEFIQIHEIVNSK